MGLKASGDGGKAVCGVKERAGSSNPGSECHPQRGKGIPVPKTYRYLIPGPLAGCRYGAHSRSALGHSEAIQKQ